MKMKSIANKSIMVTQNMGGHIDVAKKNMSNMQTYSAKMLFHMIK